MKSRNPFEDYKNIFLAMEGDKKAIDFIELKYGKISNIGMLYELGNDLFDQLADEEKHMIPVFQ